MNGLYRTIDEGDTFAFAQALAPFLKAGDTVLLDGDLGTGKSVFARGLALALGVKENMPSPTFVLMIPYDGDVRVYHYDLYRLSDPDEFYACGLDEFIGNDGVAIVEWPQQAELSIPEAFHIRIQRSDESDSHRFIALEVDDKPGVEEALRKWAQ